MANLPPAVVEAVVEAVIQDMRQSQTRSILRFLKPLKNFVPPTLPPRDENTQTR